MNKEPCDLEWEGPVVGDVRGDNACSLGHLVAGNVQLTHLSQAACGKGGKDVRRDFRRLGVI